MDPLIIAIIITALIFDFLNGVHDSSNVVATMISSRALPPRVALWMTAAANFVGPFIFGVAVAETIGNEVVKSEAISLPVILAALLSAILWNLLTWYLGFPSSSSHALIGGLIGAVVIGAGWEAILLPGLIKILLSLFLSPILGFVVGFLVLRLCYVGMLPHVSINTSIEVRYSPHYRWLSHTAQMMLKRRWGSSPWHW
jgi:PiT family inorganic phosphate transporter